MEKGFDGGTPLSSLTTREFFMLLDQHLKKADYSNRQESEAPASHGRLVYGIKAIEELFHVSHRTAQYYKDHIICEAVRQNGRKIVIDADLALKLFDERRKKQ